MAISLLDGVAAHQIAHAACHIFLEGAPQDLPRETCHALHGLERNVAGEPVAHDDVDLAVKNIPAFDIADVVDRRSQKLLARGSGQIVALALLFAVAQHADAWIGHAENSFSVDRAHETELY